MRAVVIRAVTFGLLPLLFVVHADAQRPASRIRLVIETDAGGDPDDEQSLVRFLLYTNDWDVEGMIANRARARDGENTNRERTGLGIVRRQLEAYRECWPNLIKHDPRYPNPAELWSRAVAGHKTTNEGVELILRVVDADDPRPVWYCDWGSDAGSGTNNLRRALDRVRETRGEAAYAAFKSRIRLSSADAFGEHTHAIKPAFPLWVNTFGPAFEGKRWYHRFSALTATAGDFDIERDLRQGHGPLGALYPLNTTHPQKEGDTMTFLYLVPTGMNDPLEPAWGSWGGRYGPVAMDPDVRYFHANVGDTWRGSTHRDNTVARWAADLQHDFAARADWCVTPSRARANHRPIAVLNGDKTQAIARLSVQHGAAVTLSAAGSFDPDGDAIEATWFIYSEAGTTTGPIELRPATGMVTRVTIPSAIPAGAIHVLARIADRGTPPLCAYRRAVLIVE